MLTAAFSASGIHKYLFAYGERIKSEMCYAVDASQSDQTENVKKVCHYHYSKNTLAPAPDHLQRQCPIEISHE